MFSNLRGAYKLHKRGAPSPLVRNLVGATLSYYTVLSLLVAINLPLIVLMWVMIAIGEIGEWLSDKVRDFHEWNGVNGQYRRLENNRYAALREAIVWYRANDPDLLKPVEREGE